MQFWTIIAGLLLFGLGLLAYRLRVRSTARRKKQELRERLEEYCVAPERERSPGLDLTRDHLRQATLVVARGKALLEQQKYGQARRIIAAALQELGPSLGATETLDAEIRQAYFLMGVAAFHLGDYVEAKSAFLHAGELPGVATYLDQLEPDSGLRKIHRQFEEEILSYLRRRHLVAEEEAIEDLTPQVPWRHLCEEDAEYLVATVISDLVTRGLVERAASGGLRPALPEAPLEPGGVVIPLSRYRANE